MPYIATRKLDKIQRAIARDVIQFVCHKFMSRYRNLEFTVKGLDTLLTKEYIHGDCIWTDDYVNPRQFLVRIDTTQPLRLFIETLMHELTHVKQWVLGEMKWYVREDGNRWNGKTVAKKTKYYDLPWEIEARGREYGLTEEFLTSYKGWREYVVDGATDYKMSSGGQMVLPFVNC